MANLHLRSGDDYLDNRRLIVTVTDRETGDPVDISATDLTFMVKASRRDDDVDALITKTSAGDIEIAAPQSGATLGKAYIAIEAADTDSLDGVYKWELQGEDASGVITLADGVLFVLADLVTT